MPIVLIDVPQLGGLDHRYEQIVRRVVTAEGLTVDSVRLANRVVHISATGTASADLMARVKEEVSAALWPTPAPAVPTTTIGQVVGAVHTGSGDLTINISASVLLQRLDAALDAGGTSPEQKSSVLRNFIRALREVGVDIAAKFGAELVKP